MINISRNWFLIFILVVITIVALFFNFNSSKRIYIKGDSYYVSKFLDYLSMNGIKYEVVNENKAAYVIDLDNLVIYDSVNKLKFNLKIKLDLIEKILEKLDYSDCALLKLNNNFYLKNEYFYKHFTFETTCGINIMILPDEFENVEKLVYRTFLEVLKGNYLNFENEYIVTKWYIYIVKNKISLIATYDQAYDVLELIADEKN